jgi:peptidoglycan/xylan/chitin deacetylase (PgdA/CDA1 family)
MLVISQLGGQMAALFLPVLLLLGTNLYAVEKDLFLDKINQALESSNITDFKTRLELAEEDLHHKSKSWLEKNCEHYKQLSMEQISAINQVLSHESRFLGTQCGMELSHLERAYDGLQRIIFKSAEMNAKGLFSERIQGKIKKVAPVDLFAADLNNEQTIPYRKGPVYFNADIPKGYLALTFDDGPHPVNTKSILDTLKEFNIRVTFFGVGKNIRKYEDLVKRAHEENHSFGSHSDTHANLPKLRHKSATDNIDAGRKAVSDVLNYDYPFFRFPYGSRNKSLQQWVKDQEMATFFWNIDTLDWKYKDPVVLYEYAAEQINKHQRGIVLFHDIQGQTATILPHLLKELSAAGYKFVVFVK